MIKVSLISLGCAKNLVDSEIMVGHLHQAGMAVIPDAEKADVVIVNTCSTPPRRSPSATSSRSTRPGE